MPRINNYDNEEMDINTALELLRVNGFKDITNAANEQNHTIFLYVFEHPSGDGVSTFEDDDEVIDFVEGQGLEMAPEPEDEQ
jgi:hypothetical protein